MKKYKAGINIFWGIHEASPETPVGENLYELPPAWKNDIYWEKSKSIVLADIFLNNDHYELCLAENGILTLEK